MVKQLSPVIRADGYHILSDATGVPDLYAHMGPTLRRLLPGQPARAVGADGPRPRARHPWVLIVVPVLLSLALSAVLLFPKLATNAWDSGPALVSGDAAPAETATSSACWRRSCACSHCYCP